MPIDYTVFHDNQVAAWPSVQVAHPGNWVAWSFVGTHVVARSSLSKLQVREILAARGEVANGYAVSYVPHLEDEFDGAIIVSRALERQSNGVPPYTSHSGQGVAN